MSLVDSRAERKRRIAVAKAARKALDQLLLVDAEIGGDEDLRVAIARLEEHLASVPHYVLVELRRYFGERKAATW